MELSARFGTSSGTTAIVGGYLVQSNRSLLKILLFLKTDLIF
jgi:hypothetical protein